LRHDELRRLRGACERCAGEIVHDVRRPGGRRTDHHRRGTGTGRRPASGAGRLLPGARLAVWLLHAGHDDDRRRLPRAQSQPDGWQSTPANLVHPRPLHWLRQYRQVHPVRSRKDARAAGRARHGDSRRCEHGGDPMTTPAQTLGGMGHSVKRKEDPRFLRGRGRYIDDIKLPGMIYMDIVRSPYAHAKITRIDASKALALPGVLAVITGKDLDAAGLAWMPTLMGDKKRVLPVDRVVYQAQEVAAVIATERYIAADAIQLVEVEYEPLPPVVDPFKALEADAPLVRPDREQKTN